MLQNKVTSGVPHFSSRIRLVSKPEFNRLPLDAMSWSGEYAASPWTVKDRVSLRPQGFTDMANVCNAGGITNGEKVTLFHLMPFPVYVKDFSRIRKALEADIARLKEPGKPLRAFVTGGKSHSADSVGIFEHLQDLLGDHRIPFSFLWGTPGNKNVDLHYAAGTDTWTLSAARPQDRFLEAPATLADFERTYIDAGDTLELGKDVG